MDVLNNIQAVTLYPQAQLFTNFYVWVQAWGNGKRSFLLWGFVSISLNLELEDHTL